MDDIADAYWICKYGLDNLDNFLEDTRINSNHSVNILEPFVRIKAEDRIFHEGWVDFASSSSSLVKSLTNPLHLARHHLEFKKTEKKLKREGSSVKKEIQRREREEKSRIKEDKKRLKEEKKEKKKNNNKSTDLDVEEEEFKNQTTSKYF